MKSNYSEIVFILDRSGSMSGRENDVIGGFNSFIEEQKKVDGDCDVTLVQFDHEYDTVYNKIPIQHVKNLTSDTYRPRGSTALFDAICKTIDDVGKRLARTKETNRPDNVIFVIVTDGEENNSKKYLNFEDVTRRTEHQQSKYNWKFIYLGANQDAFARGNQMFGMSTNSVKYTFDSTSGDGILRAFDAVRLASVAYRNNDSEYINKVFACNNDLTKISSNE